MAKRRLPVLAGSTPESADAGDPARAAWQWAFFGVVACFAAWLPLAGLVGSCVSRWSERRFGGAAFEPARLAALLTSSDRVLLIWVFPALHLGALAVATLVGGALVGRFGRSAGAGPRQGASAGAITGALGIALATAASGFFVGFLIVPLVAAATGALGARLFAARRSG